jgi:hypothetical protein
LCGLVERGQRVNLLGHPHGAKLGCNCRRHPARHHQACHHRTQFAGNAQRHNLRHEVFGVVARAANIDLQRQCAASEERRQADNRQREIPDAQDLLEHLAEVPRRQQAAKHGVAGEQRQPPHLCEHGQHEAA